MKTKQNKKQMGGQTLASGLPSRPDEQRSENTNTGKPCTEALAEVDAAKRSDKPARILPYVNYAEREANRALSTEKVLDLLRQWLPAAYDLAEVVGKWVWVSFTEAPAEQVRGQLSQFGFHWNNARKCWQHPCGQFATNGSSQNPREKYGTHFAADLKAA